MKKQYYIISVDKNDGKTEYLTRKYTPSQYGGARTETIGSDPLPEKAIQFALDEDKETILDWIDKAIKKLNKSHNIYTMRVIIFETSLHEISDNDVEWQTAIQRHGVNKLTAAEIKALGIEKYEIERKLSISDED